MTGVQTCALPICGESSQAKETSANAQRSGQLRQPQTNVPTPPAGVEFDILANYNPLRPGESYIKPVTPTTKAVSTKKATGAAVIKGGRR